MYLGWSGFGLKYVGVQSSEDNLNPIFQAHVILIVLEMCVMIITCYLIVPGQKRGKIPRLLYLVEKELQQILVTLNQPGRKEGK